MPGPARFRSRLRRAGLHLAVAALFLAAGAVRCTGPSGVRSGEVLFDPAAASFPQLSSYRFFTGPEAGSPPSEGVLPYDLISPLFSDYAAKDRFVWMPPGTPAAYDGEDVFEFPVGAVLIKTFAYDDERSGERGRRRVLETRLLVRRESGWEALPYVWNAEQTEARLRLGGATIPVRIPDPRGEGELAFDYLVPNKNQCKGCHAVDGVLHPIGPKARNLNRSLDDGDGTANQLEQWARAGYLSGLPPTAARPALADWTDGDSPLEDRALAYLEINCGHCHSPSGPGGTSGLHLTTLEDDPAALGFCKTPVAAGRGSGGLRYDIRPGRPDSSILLFRMVSRDPGVRMPELGRQLVHAEGVDLIRAWIAAMEGRCEAGAPSP